MPKRTTDPVAVTAEWVRSRMTQLELDWVLDLRRRISALPASAYVPEMELGWVDDLLRRISAVSSAGGCAEDASAAVWAVLSDRETRNRFVTAWCDRGVISKSEVRRLLKPLGKRPGDLLYGDMAERLQWMTALGIYIEALAPFKEAKAARNAKALLAAREHRERAAGAGK